jgi:16S rRNA processing protein RimM
MTTAADALVPIAYVAGAHGLNGEVRIKLLNPSSELLAPGRDVLVRRAGVDGDAGQRVAIRSARPHQAGSLLVTLAGCSDRNAAEALRGAELCVARAQLPALAADEYYLVDLIGLQAMTADGKVVGNVVDVHEYPAAQTLRVGVAGGEIEIPLLAPYVTEIRLDERTVIVDHVQDLEVEPAARKR